LTTIIAQPYLGSLADFRGAEGDVLSVRLDRLGLSLHNRRTKSRAKRKTSKEPTQTATEITLDLIIRYGFQVLGAIIILAVGVLG
jgi:hypothetical protein